MLNDIWKIKTSNLQMLQYLWETYGFSPQKMAAKGHNFVNCRLVDSSMTSYVSKTKYNTINYELGQTHQ